MLRKAIMMKCDRNWSCIPVYSWSHHDRRPALFTRIGVRWCAYFEFAGSYELVISMLINTCNFSVMNLFGVGFSEQWYVTKDELFAICIKTSNDRLLFFFVMLQYLRIILSFFVNTDFIKNILFIDTIKMMFVTHRNTRPNMSNQIRRK